MANSPHQHEHTARLSSEMPSLLDWHSLSSGPEIRVSASNAASALGLIAMMENHRDGKDIEFVGTGVKVKGYTINGIRKNDVQGFRESETYPYTES